MNIFQRLFPVRHPGVELRHKDAGLTAVETLTVVGKQPVGIILLVKGVVVSGFVITFDKYKEITADHFDGPDNPQTFVDAMFPESFQKNKKGYWLYLYLSDVTVHTDRTQFEIPYFKVNKASVDAWALGVIHQKS